uniref:EMI domain-containing protein n=1 Tax=Clastoptera arizonana TaxID=38151 RepID=A0A1B6DJA0_9HEMI
MVGYPFVWTWIFVIINFISPICTQNNTCHKTESYKVDVRVPVREPVTYRSYTWCLKVPPRCSKYTVQYRERLTYETEVRTRVVTECCPGFVQLYSKCVTNCTDCSNMFCNTTTNHCTCLPGFQGNHCNESCEDGKWGDNCSEICTCRVDEECNKATGYCSPKPTKDTQSTLSLIPSSNQEQFTESPVTEPLHTLPSELTNIDEISSKPIVLPTNFISILTQSTISMEPKMSIASTEAAPSTNFVELSTTKISLGLINKPTQENLPLSTIASINLEEANLSIRQNTISFKQSFTPATQSSQTVTPIIERTPTNTTDIAILHEYTNTSILTLPSISATRPTPLVTSDTQLSVLSHENNFNKNKTPSIFKHQITQTQPNFSEVITTFKTPVSNSILDQLPNLSIKNMSGFKPTDTDNVFVNIFGMTIKSNEIPLTTKSTDLFISIFPQITTNNYLKPNKVLTKDSHEVSNSIEKFTTEPSDSHLVKPGVVEFPLAPKYLLPESKEAAVSHRDFLPENYDISQEANRELNATMMYAVWINELSANSSITFIIAIVLIVLVTVMTSFLVYYYYSKKYSEMCSDKQTQKEKESSQPSRNSIYDVPGPPTFSYINAFTLEYLTKESREPNYDHPCSARCLLNEPVYDELRY